MFEGGRLSTHLNVVSDGEQALAFLRREGIYESAPRPKLVLLDLNLPRKDGREVLEELKSDAHAVPHPGDRAHDLRGRRRDIMRAYELQANCFITKPLDLDEYFAVVRSIEDFWLATARLPSS